MNFKISPFFSIPLMEVQLDLDLEKLTEFVFHIREKNKGGFEFSNMRGYHSTNILEEKHEEFEKLKKKINEYSQIYYSEVFREMVFKGNIIHNISSIWVNINEKYHHNEWHIHHYSTLSGVFYVKHDGSVENGNFMFKHPKHPYLTSVHWPRELIEETNEVTTEIVSITPKSNMLLIFPSWLEHNVGSNLKDDNRITIGLNLTPSLEKKSQ